MNVRKAIAFGATLLAGISLAGCNNASGLNSNNNSSKSTSKITDNKLKNAKTDVDSLFDDAAHTKLLTGTTLESINNTAKEVSSLKRSKTKSNLQEDIKTAKNLWSDFRKESNHKYSESFAKSDSKLTADEKKQNSESASESSKEASESKRTASSEKIDPSTQQQTKYAGSKNRVYGKLTDNAFHRDSKTALYKTSKDNSLNYVEIAVYPKTKEIRQVHLDFTDSPLLQESRDWKDYLEDWMETDAPTSGQKISDTEWQFTSSSIGKTYTVKLTLNDEPAVTNIYISER